MSFKKSSHYLQQELADCGSSCLRMTAKYYANYTRRGYDSKEMNTDDFVWNMAISRAVLKGKLILKLQGFDILHNLSNVTYNLNGQGRTEIWRRSIPNYWMLHVQWRFNKNPKHKN